MLFDSFVLLYLRVCSSTLHKYKRSIKYNQWGIENSQRCCNVVPLARRPREEPERTSILPLKIVQFVSSSIHPRANGFRRLDNSKSMIGATSNGALHIIREVRFQYAHSAPLVIGENVGREWTIEAGVDQLEVLRIERGHGVPSVDVLFALVTEEEGATVVRAQEDDLAGLGTEIVNPTVSRAVS